MHALRVRMRTVSWPQLFTGKRLNRGERVKRRTEEREREREKEQIGCEGERGKCEGEEGGRFARTAAWNGR